MKLLSRGVLSQHNCDEAIKLARIVIGAVKNRDFDVLPKTINYPITITAINSGKKFYIEDQEEFLRLNFDKVFYRQNVLRVVNTQYMFVNGDIWLSAVQNQIKVICTNKF